MLHAATDVPSCGFAEIRGVVTAGDTGLPLADIDVEGQGEQISEDATTTGSGSYTLTLPVYRDKGPYQLVFAPPNQSPYLAFVPTPTQAVSGATTFVDAVLPRGGALVGQVKTSDTGQPMEGVRIRASARTILEDNDPFVQSTNTDAEGRFAFLGLTSGGYVLRYNPKDIAASEAISTYATAFVGGANYLSDAALFTVTAPLTTTVNFTIAQGKRLAGEVRRGDTNAAATDIQADLYLLDQTEGGTGSGRGDFVQSTETDSLGIYEFLGVAPGDYLIHARPLRAVFAPQLPNVDLKAAWYDGASTSEEAQTVEIPVASAPTITVNFTLEVGAIITGVVTDAHTGMPVEGIGVDVRPSIGVEEVTQVRYQIRTDASGVYTLPGLYAGTYGIVWDAGLTAYRTVGVDTFTGITLTVSGTGMHPNANFSVQQGGEIEGVLRDAENQPLPDIVVSLIAPTTGRILRTISTNALGAYSFSSVMPGEYNIKYDRFEPCGCYNNEYYSGEQPGEVGVISVESQQSTSGVNAQLACNTPPAIFETLYMPRVQP